MKLGAKRAERAKVRATKSRQNFSRRPTRSTPLFPKLMFWCVSYRLGVLRPFGCLTKLGAKRSELVKKFVTRTRVGIFRNESIRSTPWDPKLMFLCVSYYLGAFGTVWLRNNTQCKTGQTGGKVRDMKSRQNFSQRTPPTHPSGPKTHNFVHFVLF